jgi:prepilin-type N-terminal cleavage/methylation domain-containing protein
MTSTARRGFTLIELLMVISIIAVLSSMIVMVAMGLGGDAKKKKTGVIIATIRKGIELTIAGRGGSVSPTEHPFAGSRETRFPFLRAYDGSAVATTGLAFKGVDLSQMAAGASGIDHLLADDDVFNDPRVPMLFGAKREVMCILGATQKLVTKYLQLPKPGPSSLTAANIYGKSVPVVTDNVGSASGPFNDTNIPNATNPTQDQDQNQGDFGLSFDNKRALDYIFGASGAGAELSSLKALASAPDMDVNTPDEKRFKYPIVGAGGSGIDSFTPQSGLLRWQEGTTTPDTSTACKVYTNAATDSSPQVSDTWKPGYIKHGSGGGPVYKEYRLPGLAVYDAWGHEILYSISPKGGVRLISAGADGVLKFNPGANHVLDTTLITPKPLTTTPTGDDTDGAKDNVAQEVEDI